MGVTHSGVTSLSCLSCVMLCKLPYKPLPETETSQLSRKKMDSEYDYLFKIIIIGDKRVGKSSIIKRFKEGSFHEGSLPPTIGIDFHIKDVEIGQFKVKVRRNKHRSRRSNSSVQCHNFKVQYVANKS